MQFLLNSIPFHGMEAFQMFLKDLPSAVSLFLLLFLSQIASRLFFRPSSGLRKKVYELETLVRSMKKEAAALDSVSTFAAHSKIKRQLNIKEAELKAEGKYTCVWKNELNTWSP